jgi:hypothetical protein
MAEEGLVQAFASLEMLDEINQPGATVREDNRNIEAKPNKIKHGHGNDRQIHHNRASASSCL